MISLWRRCRASWAAAHLQIHHPWRACLPRPLAGRQGGSLRASQPVPPTQQRTGLASPPSLLGSSEAWLPNLGSPTTAVTALAQAGGLGPGPSAGPAAVAVAEDAAGDADADAAAPPAAGGGACTGARRYRGVYWHKASNKWRANIKHDGKKVALGAHVNEDDAAKAFDRAAIRYDTCGSKHSPQRRWSLPALLARHPRLAAALNDHHYGCAPFPTQVSRRQGEDQLSAQWVEVVGPWGMRGRACRCSGAR